MKYPRITTGLAYAALALLFGTALAQTPPQAQRVPRDFGKSEFEASCASCHGVSGKGNGPLLPFLRSSPPDLTLLAKKNQGVFPMDRLYEVIDAENVPAHGSRDMPVWGRAYRIQDAEYYQDTEYDAKALVRARVLSLLEYINRIQVR